MKVNLAAQTLSKSVADALEFLWKDLQLEEFKEVMATVKFIRHFNNIFDLLNSRNPFGKGMNSPLRRANENYWRGQMEDILKYIQELKMLDGTLVWKTRKQVPFIGFIVSATSLLQIYEEEVKHMETLKYILTYKFSQDHLELFFCSVRSRNGSNNNPNCLQFMHIYRRLLMHIDVKNNTGNCLTQDDTNILQVSSAKKETEITDIMLMRKRETDIEQLEEKIAIFLPLNLNEYAENVIAHISGFVVRSLRKNVTCTICIEALIADFDEVDTSLKLLKRISRGGLIYPSQGVRNICYHIEKKIQITYKVLGNLPPRSILIDLLSKECITLLDNVNIFPILEEHVFDYAPYEHSHKKILIDAIIRTYASVRLNSLAHSINENISGEQVRKTLTKLILFKHQ